MIRLLVFFFALVFQPGAWVLQAQGNDLVQGTWWKLDRQQGTAQQVSLEELAQQTQSDSILLVGEIHDSTFHQRGQLDLLEALTEQGLHFDVGMEFFNRRDQLWVEMYMTNGISEEEFLTKIGWGGGYRFDLYREQTLWPRSYGGLTWGLNLPRSITGKVMRQGLDSLTEEEAQYIPRNFQAGNALYRERFEAIIEDQHGGHKLPPEVMDRWFLAQSLWDDYMAETIVDEAFKTDPSEPGLVVIVGSFHVEYGGGLKDRLVQRGIAPERLISITQHFIFPWEEPEQIAQKLAQPHDRYGVIADYIHLTYPDRKKTLEILQSNGFVPTPVP